ncbi:MAG: L,D-transpeptidase [Armatimonadetes bacterium]|nr:L,D-transpeptidase [Armatimonadota bacterium]
MQRFLTTFLLAILITMSGAAQPIEMPPVTVYAQPPLEVEPETKPEQKPVGKSKPNVRWESPLNGSVLFLPGEFTLDWSSTFPENTVYTTALSLDGKRFTVSISDGTFDTSVPWKPAGISQTKVWLRVAATGPDGTRAEHIIAVRTLPRDAIIVSKANQRLWALENGVVKHRWLVSTGKRDLDTRAGWFSVYMRNKDHHSREYDVPMPFALFFSGGQAIHASTALRRLGSPASHGCVRLPRRYAQTLFEESKVGRPVIVTPWGEDFSFLDRFRASAKPAKAPAKPKAVVVKKTPAPPPVKPVAVAPPAVAIETAPAGIPAEAP